MARRFLISSTFKIVKSIVGIVMILVSFRSFAAQESAQTFTLDGRLYSGTSTTTPLASDPSVVFKVQILSSGQDCVLYEEQQTSATDSTGSFTINIGSRTGSAKRTIGASGDPGNTMAKIFQNTSVIPAASGSCAGNQFDPTALQSPVRYLKITVTPSSTGVPDTFTNALRMDAVPNAWVAESIQGYGPSDLLLVKDDASYDLNQANLENIFSVTNYPELTALLAGTSTKYLSRSTAAGASLPSYAGNPTTPVAGSMWYDSTNKVIKYHAGVDGIKTITNLGTSIDGSSITSGTIGGTTSFNSSGDVTAANMSATSGSFNNLKIFRADNTKKITITALPGLAADYGLVLPADDGNANQFMMTDGAGNLSWGDAILNGGGTPSITSGTFATRPAFGTAGRIYVTTDTKEIFRDTGAAWELIGTGDANKLGAFANGGNAFGAAAVLGTTDNFDLSIKTNNVDSIVVKNNNTVGIGTNAPNGKLEVRQASGTGDALVIHGGASTVTMQIRGNGDAIKYIGHSGAVFASNTLSANALGIRADDGIQISTSTSGINGITITTGGDVGIGTAAPGSKLHVQGAITAGPSGAAAGNTGAIQLRELAANGTNAFTIKAPDDLTAARSWILPDSDGTSGYVLTTNGSGVLSWVSPGAATAVSAADGTAAAPSINFSNDTNTGFWRPGNDQIGIAANGANVFTVSASGLVSPTNGGGIVTTAAGSVTAPTFSFTGDTNTGIYNPVSDTISIVSGGVEAMRFATVASGVNYLQATPAVTGAGPILGSAGADANIDLNLTPKGTGNVVVTSGQVVVPAGSQTGASFTFSGDTDTGFYSVGADQIGVTTGGTVRATFGSSYLSSSTAGGPQLSFGGTTSAGAPGFTFNGDTDLGIYRPAADTLGFSTGGAERARIDSSGNVGIGTSNPGFALHVRNDSAPQVTLESMGNVANTGPAFLGRRARDNAGALSAPLAGDNIATFGGRPYLTSGWSTGSSGAIVFIAEENMADAARGTRIEFQNTQNGSNSRVTTMTLKNNGALGIGTDTPGTLLDVAGSITSRPSGTGAGQTGQLIMRELAANGTNTVTLKAPDAVTSDRVFVLPDSVGTNGQTLLTDGSGNLSWGSPAAGSVVLNSVAAATATNTINNVNYAQVWNWNSLTTENAMTMASNSMTTGNVLSLTNSNNSAGSTGNVLKVTQSGASNASVGAMITNAGTGASLLINDDGTDTDTTPLIVDASGQVGIGTLTPSYKLDVNGTIRTTADVYGVNIQGAYVSAGGNGNTPYVVSSGSFSDPIQGGSFNGSMQIANTAGVDSYGSYYLMSVKNAASNTQRSYLGSVSITGAGVYSPAIVMGQQTASGAYAERLRIDSSGQLGLGTTTPGTLLDVAGSITSRPSGTGAGQTGQLIMRELAANGTNTVTIKAPDAVTSDRVFVLPDSVGSSGQALTTDGSGNLSWANPTAGGVALSGLTAATATNTINNANYAQVWNWNSLTTENAMTMASNSMTTGNVLSLTNSNNSAGSTGNVLKVTQSGTSNASTGMMITNAGTGPSLRINDDGTDTDTSPIVADASGRFGIGTSSPGNPLHVYSGNADAFILERSSAANSNIQFKNTAGSIFAGADPSANFAVGLTNNLSTNPLFMILQSGKVGVGTVNPNANLDVSVSTNAQGFPNYTAIRAINPNATIGDGTTTYNRSAIRVESGNGAVGADLMTYYESNGEGVILRSITNHPINFWTNNAYRAKIDTSGRLAIGTDTAGTLLDVAGSITSRPSGTGAGQTGQLIMRELAANGTNTVTIKAPDAVTSDRVFVLPDSVGSSGQALTTDGSGNLSWANPTAGGVSLSGLTAATATNTINNVNYAQVWNWNSLTTENAMTMASSSMTTGNVLSLTNSNNSAGSTGNILKITQSGGSNASVGVMITNAGTGAALRINDDGTDTDTTPFIIDDSGSVGIGTATTSARLQVLGNRSMPSWNTSGPGVRIDGATYTDTTSSGTVAFATTHSIAQPTLAASAASTFTRAATLYIGGGPAAGTNATISNSYGLDVNGHTRVVGRTVLGGAQDLSVNTALLNIGPGGAAMNMASWTTTGAQFMSHGSTITDTTGSGTIATRTNNSFAAPTYASSNAVTLTDAANVYIAGAPSAGTNTTITNAYALQVASGNSFFGGNLISGPSGTGAGQTGQLIMRELAANGTNTITIKAPDSMAADQTFVLPATAGSSGQQLTTDGSGNLSWAAAGSGGAALSGLTAATATNTINNANYAQVWNWNSLTTENAMTMASNSMTTGNVLSLTNSFDSATSTGNVLKVTQSGTSNASVGAMITNAGTGLSLRINDDGTDTDTTPVAVDASGKVGIGTVSPNSALDVFGQIRGTVGNVSPLAGSSSYAIVATRPDGDTTKHLFWGGTPSAAMFTVNYQGDITGGSLSTLTGGITIGGASRTLTGINTGGNLSIFNVPSGSGTGTMTIGQTGETTALLADSVGVGTNSPGTKLDVAGAITSRPSGTGAGQTGQLIMRELAANGTNTVTLKAPDAVTSDRVFVLPDSVGTSGQALTTDGSGNLSWTTVSGSAKLSALAAADATNTINSANFAQVWNWNSLTTETAMTMASNSMTTGNVLALTNSYNNATSTGNVLKVTQSGTSNASVGMMITNAGTGASLRINDDGTDTDTTPVIVDATGKMGIGTNNPSSNLTIAASDTLGIKIQSSSTGQYNAIAFAESNGAQRLVIQKESNNNLGFWTATGSAGSESFNQRMVIDTAGKVGIGTDAPGDKLSIRDSVNSGVGISVVNASSGASAASTLDFDNNVGGIGTIWVASSAYSTSHLRNRLNISSNDTNADGISLFAEKSTADIRMYTGGFAAANERMRILSDGKVGIGTDTPGTLLDVAGSITSRPSGTGAGQTGQLIMRELAANGTNTITIKAPDSVTADRVFVLPDSVGSSGQALTTDGSGNLSWASPSVSNSQSSLTNFTFNSNSDNSGSDGGFNFQVNGSNVLSIANSGATTFSGNVTGAAITARTGSTALYATNATASDTNQIVTYLGRERSDTTAPGAGFSGTLGLALEGRTNNQFPYGASIQWGWEGAQSTNDTTDRDAYLAFATTLDNTNSSTGGTERMRINSAGSVGIGTTTPGTLLDVAGAITSRPYGTGAGQSGQLILRELAANGTNTITIKAADNMTADRTFVLPATAGSNGQVLQTDGSGNLSWAAAGGGGSIDGLSDGATPGTDNLYLGTQAGPATYTTNGDYNVAIGNQAFKAATTADNNISIGAWNMRYLQTGSNNTAIGSSILWNASTITDLYANTLIGAEVMGNAQQVGVNLYRNTAVGTQAMNNAIDSYDNSVLGNVAMKNVSGAENTMIGAGAGQGATSASGTGNAFLGYSAGSVITGADNNVAVGHQAGVALTSGDNNIMIGKSAGDNITTGSNNLIIGYNIDAPSATGSNQMSIGNIIYGTSIDGTGTTLSSGNVGIGTATPGAKLDVNGAIKIKNIAKSITPTLLSWNTNPTNLGNATDENEGNGTTEGIVNAGGTAYIVVDLGAVYKGIVYSSATIRNGTAGQTTNAAIYLTEDGANFIGCQTAQVTGTTATAVKMSCMAWTRYLYFVCMASASGAGKCALNEIYFKEIK